MSAPRPTEEAPGVAALEAARARLAAGRGLYGRSLSIVAETDSTNDDARRAADEGAPRGHVVVADAQRRGRGARGSEWSSPAGTDLYVSIVERPEQWLADGTPEGHAPGPQRARLLSVLTLAVGLGVRDACVQLLEARGLEAHDRVTVKWPNDVRLDDRKCAGVLVESSSVGERLGAVIIGIGLDVNRERWPEELGLLASSLRTAVPAGGPFDRGEALVALLAGVESRVTSLLTHGPEATVAALRPHLAMRRQRVRVESLEGCLEGLDDEGALLVRTDGGELVRVRSGTLRAV